MEAFPRFTKMFFKWGDDAASDESGDAEKDEGADNSRLRGAPLHVEAPLCVTDFKHIPHGAYDPLLCDCVEIATMSIPRAFERCRELDTKFARVIGFSVYSPRELGENLPTAAIVADDGNETGPSCSTWLIQFYTTSERTLQMQKKGGIKLVRRYVEEAEASWDMQYWRSFERLDSVSTSLPQSLSARVAPPARPLPTSADVARSRKFPLIYS